jgi:ABC-type nitrate/sulfonate/bicarbonate transport system substrate-binding protein
MPGYVAKAKGFFRRHDLAVEVTIEPTGFAVAERLLAGEIDFAVMPWTRVVAAAAKGEPLVLVCGSGCEEAAVVVRKGLRAEQVKKVAVPQRGGIKDLTALGLVQSLGWQDVQWIRQPSGDGAILALVGQGADAAAMVEPYATMCSELQIGNAVKRTGDLWPGAPGCSLTTTARLTADKPDLVQRMVNAYVEAARFVEQNREESATIAAGPIGISARFIRAALKHCRPNVRALAREKAMTDIIALMIRSGYLEKAPRPCYYDGRFLERVT